MSVLHGLLFAPLVAGRHVDITGKFQAFGCVQALGHGVETKAERVRPVVASLATPRRRGAPVHGTDDPRAPPLPSAVHGCGA